jgi:hypothetical protein
MPESHLLEPPRLPQGLSENVLTLLCLSKEHGKLISQIVQPNQFDNQVHITIATRAIEYWKRHKSPPGKAHVADIVEEFLNRDNPRNTSYRAVLHGMLALEHAGMNSDYILDQLKTMAREAQLRRETFKAAELLEAKRHLAIGEVEQIYADILKSREFLFEPGTRLSDYDRALKYLESRKEEFVTGISVFDKGGVVPARGTVMLFLAPSGFGKSWFAINVGRRALQDRKRVLHITLELDETQVLVRYLQSLLAVPRDASENLVSLRIKEASKHFAGFTRRKIKPAFALTDARASRLLKTKLDWYGQRVGNLVIKYFPMRRLDMAGLAGYLDTLEVSEKFIPDLVIIDYFGVVKTDPREHRVSLGREFEEFRALMAERHMAGLSPQQVNRPGMGARIVKVTHAAEDISLINTADIAITMSATGQEREKRLARLHVSKNRDGRDQFGALITQNFDIGQFCVTSLKLDEAYWAYLRAMEDDAKENRNRRGDDDDGDVAS